MQDAKRRAMLFLVLALMLAAVAGFLFMQKVSAVDASLGDRVTVYVAAQNITSRQQLKPEYFKPVEVPEQFVQESVVTNLEAIELQENNPFPVDSFVSVVPLAEGDLLTKNVLLMKNYLQSNDKRMVTIQRSERAVFDGTFDYNDLVDIIVSEQRGNQPETIVFMNDVPVVGVAKDQQGNITGLGLEMTLEQAKQFIHKQNFSISIRILKAPNQKGSGRNNGKGSSQIPQSVPKQNPEDQISTGTDDPSKIKDSEAHTH